MRHARLTALPLLLLALLASGCAGLPGGSGSGGPAPGFPFVRDQALFSDPASLPDYARAGLGSLTTFVLPNGIPVVLKRSDANRVVHLSLVLRGGSLLATPATAGLEGLALKTMARASTTASYEEIQALLDETSSAISASSAFEYSSYSLSTLDKHFARLLPVWAGTLGSPAFAREDFEQVLSEARLALKSKEQNPWAVTGMALNEAVFAGHPWAATPEGTRESLAAASLEAVKDWYATSFSANRMFLVAVGDFEPAALRKSLEAALGGIPDRGVALPPAPPPIAVKAGLLKREYPQSKGVGYLRGDFAAPPPSAPDFMATNLAMRMLADLLFNVVRDAHGAAYSPGAYVRAFGANYGSITIFKTTVAADVKGYVDEAVAELAAGRAMSVDPTRSSGESPRMTVAEALPAYKELFLNEFWASQQTNAATAGLVAQSILAHGDYRTWLLYSARARAATAEEVSAAFRKYVVEAPAAWIVLGSRDVIAPVREADFLR